MASSEPLDVHVSEDQETNDLFNSFIDVTKDAAITNHDLNNFHEMEEKGGTLNEQHTCTVQKDQENEGIQSKEIDKKDDGNCNKNEEQKLGRNGKKTEEQNKEETVQVKNDDQVISNDKDLPQEAEKHIGKRLSKAVDELSDLEKQLSLMISDSSKYGAQQNSASAVLETDADKAGVKDNSEEEKSSNSTEDKSQEVLSHFEGVVDVIATTGGHETGGETSDAEHNASDKEEPATTKTVGDGEEIKSAEITEQSKEDEAMKTGSEEDCPSEGDKEIPHSQSSSGGIQNGDVFSGAEKLNDDDVNSSDAPASETYPENSTPDASCTISQKQGKEEDSYQKSEDIVVKCNSSSEKSTNNIREDKQDEGENGNPDSSLGDKSKESSSEELDGKLIRKDSSAPDIEILMTDESGISERKSLDSLDIDLDESNPIQPDSPALTDEGIDSDSKSDLGDEDDTFDTSGDFSFMSKSGHLDVDRSRTGSDSSTLSEQEFKRDLTDYKKNGNNEDTADQICMEGYLLKLGGSGLTPRNWRKRWFALRCDNCLYYYKHSKDKVPCGVIVLCNYSITKAPEFNRKYCFKLNKGGARSYHLCAASDDEMRKWMVSLMSAATEVASDGTSFQISEGSVHNVSIPALSIRDPECHGYLSKQGLNIKNWKRRYCVLKNGYLYYYSDMSNTTALGVAKLLGYKIKPGEKRGRHYCFYGSPPDESLRTYHFSAETENDRDRWMTRMEESIAKGNTSQNTQE